MHLLLRLSEDPENRVVFRLVEGDFLEYQGVWDIDAIQDATRLRLSLRLRPAFFAPEFMLNRIVSNSVEKSLIAIYHKSIRRSRRLPQ